MQKGVGNTDLSMFGDETRIVLLKKAADEFLAVIRICQISQLKWLQN